MTALSSENLVYLIGISSLLTLFIQAYNSIIKPQNNSEKTDAVLGQQLTTLQQDFANLRDNHVHTMQISLDSTNQRVGDLTTKVAVLAQIIDERIPKK